MSDQVRVKQRHRVVVDQRELAQAIGTRIRSARLAARLTQQELAGDRYTKAYISALELGHAKPSMAALDYLAPRLGTTPAQLLADESGRWTRVDADLHLAAGRLRDAAEAYGDLADRATDAVARGELLLGAGEAHARMRDATAAGPLLAQARHLLEQGGRPADRVRAQYWQAWTHMALDDPLEARRLLHQLLESDLSLAEDPDIEIRIRIALASIENDHGSPDRGRLYLEEARDRIDGFDSRRRAVYFDVLARVRRDAGDAEGAIRAGMQAITLYRAAEQPADVAELENQLALAFIQMGNLDRAAALVDHAIEVLRGMGAESPLAHALDTRATLLLRREDPAGALELAEQALEIESRVGPQFEQVGARITRARALAALGRIDEANEAWADAGAAAGTLQSPARRARILSAWAESLAAQGRHAEAYEVMRRAV